MGDLFSGIFGHKSWYQSLTAWGLGVYTVLGRGLGTLCAPDSAMVESAFCAYAASGFQLLGSILVVLGLRKAAATKPTVTETK